MGRCRVEDDVVVLVAQMIDQFVELVAHQQLCGVGRGLLADDVVEVIGCVAVRDVLVDVAGFV